jgi:hypothetical protein
MVDEEHEQHNNFIYIKSKNMNKKILITLLILLVVKVIQAQNNAIFFGGSGDGHAAVSYLQTVNEINKGGDGDGWTSLNYAQLVSNISLGGDGDGWSSLSYIQGGDTSLFIGGDGDGWASNSYAQIADSALFRGGDGDGWASIVLPVGPLPIELLSFTGKPVNAYHELNWETNVETNSSHFVLELSSDATNFRELGMRNAAGNSNEKTNKTPFVGNNFYRLKMVDLDGKFKYSNIVLLKVLADKSSVSVYPNPSASILNVDILNLKNNTSIKMKVYDMAGKTIWASENKYDGTSIQIDITNYALGIYQLYIETPTDKQIVKFRKF